MHHPRIKIRIGAVVLFLLAISTPVAWLAGEEPPDEYIIGAGDVLQIFVWKALDVSGEFEVGPDGYISLPLIGEVLAHGETRSSLARKIEKKLRVEYKTPIVSVHVSKYMSRYVYVIGRVRNPGLVVISGEPTLLKALALAGGVITESKARAYYWSEGLPTPMGIASIIRGNNQVILVDLDELLREGNTDLNLTLEPGDVINIFTEIDAYVYVMGEVNRPGLYDLRLNMTVLDAVGLAGGYTRDAQAHGVRVVRGSGEDEEILKLDLYDVMKRHDQQQNIKLLAKDIVFLPLKGVAKFSYYVRNTIPSLTTIFLGYTSGQNMTGDLP